MNGNWNMKPLSHFSDIHTHVPGRTNSILSISPNEVEGICASNAQLPEAERQSYSLQLHPWHVRTEADIETFVQCALEHRNDPQFVAIGECGLDGLCSTPLPLQEQAFLAALQVAQQLQLPVIIHCVRLWDRLLALTSSFKPNPDCPLIIHGFRKGPQLAQQLLKAGFSISIGPLHNREVAAQIPPEHLYHETDEMPLTE